jgi:hypothetical protein
VLTGLTLFRPDPALRCYNPNHAPNNRKAFAYLPLRTLWRDDPSRDGSAAGRLLRAL